MSYRCCVRGAQGGVLAGLVVMLFFFVADLVRLDPFATPIAISGYVLGPGGLELDLPVVSQAVALATFGARLVTVTLLHFLAFSLLGVGFVILASLFGSGATLVAGFLYGIGVGTAVFYGAVAVVGRTLVVAAPGLVWVLVANAMAGLVIAGFVRGETLEPEPVPQSGVAV